MKEIIVLAVKGGLITIEYLLKTYQISPEEYIEWCTAYDERGFDGLVNYKLT